jgi:hypothetical protein
MNRHSLLRLSLWARLFGMFPPAWAEDQVVTVVAEGVGADAKAATDSAVRNAVQQALGAFVDAQVQVDNDKIVQDTVLSHSDGFAEKITVLSQGERQGLIVVRASVVVLKTKLYETVKGTGITVSSIDGQSLGATLATQEAQDTSAAALITKALQPLLGVDTITPTVVGDPEILDRESGTLRFTVALRHDLEKSKTAIANLEQVLKGVADDVTEEVVPIVAKKQHRDAQPWGQQQAEWSQFFLGPDGQTWVPPALLTVERSQKVGPKLRLLAQQGRNPEYGFLIIPQTTPDSAICRLYLVKRDTAVAKIIAEQLMDKSNKSDAPAVSVSLQVFTASGSLAGAGVCSSHGKNELARALWSGSADQFPEYFVVASTCCEPNIWGTQFPISPDPQNDEAVRITIKVGKDAVADLRKVEAKVEIVPGN